jgi:hypothetical protein
LSLQPVVEAFEFQRPRWQQKAACRGLGPGWFYLPLGNPAREKYDWLKIRGLCSTCPVHQQCFEWGLEHEVDGVWAATPPRAIQAYRSVAGVTVDVPVSVNETLTQKQDPRCGTHAGYLAHRRRLEQPCPGCKAGHHAVEAARRGGQSGWALTRSQNQS